jgi:hypothetical protein
MSGLGMKLGRLKRKYRGKDEVFGNADGLPP